MRDIFKDKTCFEIACLKPSIQEFRKDEIQEILFSKLWSVCSEKSLHTGYIGLYR